MPRRQAEHVVADENLPITVGACSDANGRHVELAGKAAGKLEGYRFENDAEDTGILKGLSIREHRVCLFWIRALPPIAPELMHRLREQAKVTHDRNADVHEPTDHIEHRSPALELDGSGAPFLKEPSGVSNRL